MRFKMGRVKRTKKPKMAENFKKVRKALHKTQFEFSEMLGISEQQIRNYESDRQDIPFYIIELITNNKEFYINEFNDISAICGKNPLIPTIIANLKQQGYRMAVATNPLFPLRANESRLNWAGLSLSNFEFCTCYENSCYCKPTLNYYQGILDILQVTPEECIMVGNDVKEDMIARELGMDVFLITDCLLNVENRDINEYPHGSWGDFEEYIESL